ncbi:GAF domain-containing protein [Candidatus Bipolaricaulota bacterium]|nr:GAF domain-containing protein [Candidatus Bipolaricaulota bacterium]
MDTQRAARYERLHEQLRELIENKSPSLQAAMATICAVLHAKMQHHFWTGFYFVASEDELHVGPYQGPVACQILKGQGVCLHAARTKEPVVVPDVEEFANHIACDSRSKSEIVIPLLKDSRAIAVLDIDSTELNQFTEADIVPLSKILDLLTPYS